MTGMDTALSIHGLTKRFGGLTAVDNIDIQFPKGILNAVIGPNGAGKTTLFNLVTGMVPATSGRVMFEGNDLIGRAPHEILSRGLSRTLQIKSVFGGMSVMDNIRIAVFAHEGISSPFRPARGYRAANDRVEHILEDTGLDRLASSSAGALSYGDVALLEIALALANKPRLLLLDEPICGMSPSETERTVVRIVRLAKTTDIILIEHDMEVVFAIADLITVMAQGQLLMQGTPNEVAGDSRVQEVYLGTPEDMECAARITPEWWTATSRGSKTANWKSRRRSPRKISSRRSRRVSTSARKPSDLWREQQGLLWPLQLVKKVVVADERVHEMPDHQPNAREELEVFVYRKIDIAVHLHFVGEHR